MEAVQHDNVNPDVYSQPQGPPTQDVGDDYEIPPPETSVSFSGLKDRIKRHYEVCSDYYYSLWGEHIHHGYFLDPADTKEVAQARLIDLLLERSSLSTGSRVLDVGCGIGGTARFLAKKMDASVTGITISEQQVKLANNLSTKEAGSAHEADVRSGFTRLEHGQVRFLELDAENMGGFFTESEERKMTFDCVWISEAMSHLPDKALFFRNASMLLNAGGKVIVADWFKVEGLTDAQLEADIKPIEDGMLLPGLNTQSEYVEFAAQAGFRVFSKPLDISKEVSKTWDISWAVIQKPALWAFAVAQGRDGLAFLQAFRAMRRGYANGTFRYAVMVFQK